MNEFADLLQQLNVNFSQKEISRIFNDVNTDRTEVEGEQVSVVDYLPTRQDHSDRYFYTCLYVRLEVQN